MALLSSTIIQGWRTQLYKLRIIPNSQDEKTIYDTHMNKKMNKELLSAYVKGNISKKDRDKVRAYLADKPNQLEDIVIMMDDHLELNDIVPPPSSDLTFDERLSELMKEVFPPSIQKRETANVTELLSGNSDQDRKRRKNLKEEKEIRKTKSKA